MEIIRCDVCVLQQVLPTGDGKIGYPYVLVMGWFPNLPNFFKSNKFKKFLEWRDLKLFAPVMDDFTHHLTPNDRLFLYRKAETDNE